MSGWMHNIDLSQEWPLAESVALSPQNFSTVVVKKLRAIGKYDDEILSRDLENLIGRFEELSEDEKSSKDEFDDVMDDLYEWADTSLDGRWNGKRALRIRIIAIAD